MWERSPLKEYMAFVRLKRLRHDFAVVSNAVDKKQCLASRQNLRPAISEFTFFAFGCGDDFWHSSSGQNLENAGTSGRREVDHAVRCPTATATGAGRTQS